MTEFLVVPVSHKKDRAKIELLDAILLADKEVEISETEYENMLKVTSKLNEDKFLHLIVRSFPRYIARVVPIYKICNLNEDAVLESVLSLLNNISTAKKIKVICKSKKSKRLLDSIKVKLVELVRERGFELEVVNPELIVYLEATNNDVVLSLLKDILPLSLYSLRVKAYRFVKNITEESEHLKKRKE